MNGVPQPVGQANNKTSHQPFGMGLLSCNKPFTSQWSDRFAFK